MSLLQRRSFLCRPAFPVFRTTSGTFGRNHRFRLAAQDVRLQPIVQVQPEFLFGTGRHPVTVLIEPCPGFVQPAARLVGLTEPLVGQGQPQPVENRPARLWVGLEALLEERHCFLEPAGAVRQGPLLGQ